MDNKKNIDKLCDLARYGIGTAAISAAVKRTGKVWPLMIWLTLCNMEIHLGGNEKSEESDNKNEH